MERSRLNKKVGYLNSVQLSRCFTCKTQASKKWIYGCSVGLLVHYQERYSLTTDVTNDKGILKDNYFRCRWKSEKPKPFSTPPSTPIRNKTYPFSLDTSAVLYPHMLSTIKLFVCDTGFSTRKLLWTNTVTGSTGSRCINRATFPTQQKCWCPNADCIALGHCISRGTMSKAVIVFATIEAIQDLRHLNLNMSSIPFWQQTFWPVISGNILIMAQLL